MGRTDSTRASSQSSVFPKKHFGAGSGGEKHVYIKVKWLYQSRKHFRTMVEWETSNQILCWCKSFGALRPIPPGRRREKQRSEVLRTLRGRPLSCDLGKGKVSSSRI